MKWPEGRDFAFTVFDDPDSQTLAGARTVYDFLAGAGLRTTIGVWPSGATREVNSPGETCANIEYRQYVQSLQRGGFEVGYHNTTPHSSFHNEIAAGLETFSELFGTAPITMANHYNAEAIYWGRQRIGGVRRAIYDAVTLGRNKGQFSGEVPGSPHFWGDLCESRVRFCRNFTYDDINTLRMCPWMPYHDKERPYVKYWFASSNGPNAKSCLKLLSESNQDALEEQGGACILYTHFGLGFVQDGVLDSRFRSLMQRLSRKNGWFVPVETLLNYLLAQRGDAALTAEQRRNMEWRWLSYKWRKGTF